MVLDDATSIINHEYVFMNEHSPRSAIAPRTPGAHRPVAGGRAIRADALRGRLLAAAEVLIAERQVAAITARDIAREAGVSDGVLYNHFEDKHDLVLAALLARFARLVQGFEVDVAGVRQADPPLPLEAGLDRLVAAAFGLHSAILPMLAHVLSEPALFHRFMVAVHHPPFGGQIFLDPFEDYVGAERALGATGDIDPAAAADLLTGAVLMLAFMDLMSAREAANREARLRKVVRTLLAGLLPRT